MDRPPVRYSERELREIIARALRTPDREYSQADLEAAAAELGIEPHVLSMAIAHVVDRPSPVRHLAKGVLGSAVVGSGLAVFSTTMAVGQHVTGMAITAALSMPTLVFIAGSFVRAGRSGRWNAIVHFETRNFALWGTYAVSVFASSAWLNPAWWTRFGNETAFICAALGSLTALVGGVAVGLRTRKADSDTTDGSTATWKTRLASRLKRWIDHVLTRVWVGQMRATRERPAVVRTEFNGA
jgi:hypothetical protein